MYIDQNLIQRLNALDDIASILEIICATSGMRFVAVARVTEQKWTAYCVKDDANFGLKPGDELELESTLCNEIRQHHLPILIDHVSMDQIYQVHHTPKIYGFQSYISVPIFLKDGSFFGTLCALDKEPLKLKDGVFRQMFVLFAKMIATHIESIGMPLSTERTVS